MTIIRAELPFYRSKKTSDTTPSQNGGRFNDASLITSGVVSNVFDDVSEAERTAGITEYRKIFPANRNNTGIPGEVLFNPRLYVENYTPADDEVYLTLGTQDGTENIDIVTPDWYGSSQLTLDITGGVTNPIRVTIPNFTNLGIQPFRDGEVIRLSDKPDIDAAGNTEFATIATSGVSAVGGDVFDLTLTAPPGNSFLATATRVGSVLDLTGDATYGSLTPNVENIVDTNSLYDEVTYPPQVFNVGAIRQLWTVEVIATGPTTLQLTGDEIGVVNTVAASGGFFTWANPAGGTYLRLTEAGVNVSPTIGWTMTLDTNPAAIPIWLIREVPTGTPSLAGNKAIIVFDGESA